MLGPRAEKGFVQFVFGDTAKTGRRNRSRDHRCAIHMHSAPSDDKETSMEDELRYDIVVVGAGIVGATTALALAQSGLKTLVVEATSHPRFAIGESTVPLTTANFELIANKWNIPEIRDLTRYVACAKPTPAQADYPKALFWFGHHEQGRPLELSHELVWETLDPPMGPDTHILREKMDAYLASLFPKYKVDYQDKTVVDTFERAGDQTCHLVLVSQGGQTRRRVASRFVIDATGHSAFFAKTFGYFLEDRGELQTNTRVIYSHFKFASIPDLDELLGGACLLYRVKRSAGTMHHCFDGGWIWIIPLDNDSVSVGMVLDCRKYPERRGVGAKEEFYSIIEKFPTVAAHLGHAEPVMPFVRKQRSQIMSKSILGDGVIITPHAAAFIDPLFSTGMVLSTTFVRTFVPLLTKAFKTKNFGMDQFRLAETIFFRDIRQVDLLVSGTIESFRHIEVLKQFWRTWVCGGLYQFAYNILLRGDEPCLRLCGLYGANNDVFREDVEKMWSILMEGRERDQLATAADLKKIIDRHWHFTPNHHLYKHQLEQIGSKFPFKVLFKAGKKARPHPAFVRKVVAYERAHIVLPTVAWRIFSQLIVNPTSRELKLALGLVRKDGHRARRIAEQRLPWSQAEILK
jgi:FADH2 O2-dependent halogenase